MTLPQPWDIYWPTLALAVLALVAAIIAIYALAATKKAADAALLNARALADSERAWIMVTLEWAPGYPKLARHTTIEGHQQLEWASVSVRFRYAMKVERQPGLTKN